MPKGEVTRRVDASKPLGVLWRTLVFTVETWFLAHGV